jgi:hypothetical protein
LVKSTVKGGVYSGLNKGEKAMNRSQNKISSFGTIRTLRREILRAQRSAYLGMRSDGVISEEVYEQLSAEVDASLEDGGGPFWFVPQESLPRRLKEGISGTALVEDISIEPGSTSDAKLVTDIAWPDHFVIASLR